MAVAEEPAAAPAVQVSPKLKKAPTAVTDTSSTASSSDNEKSTKPSSELLHKEPQEQPTRRSLRADSLGVDRSSRPHFKEGIRLAEMGKWTALIDRVASEPQLARHKDHHGMLPLHWACTEDDTPPKAVRALLAAFPEAVITKNNAQYLPIHIAVKARAPLDTLKLLVEARPSSLMEETPAGKTVIQLAKEMQLPQGAMEMLQRAEQDYLDLSEDDDEAFDYEDVKREIEVQSQLLRESMLHPPSMNGPNASLPPSNPIGAAFDLGASQNPFENSQNMVTTLSFVDGTLVQSQCNLSKSVSLPRKTEGPTQQVVTDTLSPPPTSLATQPRGAPALGPGRSKSAREIPKRQPPRLLMTLLSDDRSMSLTTTQECAACATKILHKHVAGKIMLPNYTKKRSVCGDCYRIHRNGPMSSNTASGATGIGARAARASGSHISGSGPPSDKKGPNLRTTASLPAPSTVSAPSTVVEATDTISANSSMLARTTRADSTHSMVGRPSNVPGPQMNLRYSTNTAGARPNRVPSGGRTHGSNTAISDTTVSLTDSDHQAADVSVLQHRIATLEECNKILMTRVADQEKQYNEAMLLLTTTMTRVAEMEIRLPTEQRKSYRGTGGSTTASERASEVDNNEKFSFATPLVEKYD
ncbi:Ankyrin repeat-containing domain [Phytophthora cactorum]|nr:Ankyrin repeat-containing domain [Phytophthora cactorum]